MKSVLFVDDEDNVLKGLALSFRGERKTLGVLTANNGNEALRMLRDRPEINVLVCDLKMPSMSGVAVLQEARDTRPDVVRMVLSGNLSGDATLEASEFAHQMLSKPCETRRLLDIVLRAISLHSRMEKFALKDRLFGLGGLPSVPKTYSRVVSELAAEKPSMERIVEIVLQDPAMSAKILNIVNSHMAGKQEVTDIGNAVSRLGLESLKSFILMAEIFSNEKDPMSDFGYSSDELWKHSVVVGQYARSISLTEPDEDGLISTCYTAGLLHDIGVLIFAAKMPNEFNKALQHSQRKNISLVNAEKELYGATHAEVGGFLLDLWGLSMPIVNAITYHYHPSAAPEEIYGDDLQASRFDVTAAVHVANYFCENEDDSFGSGAAYVDIEYLERIDRLQVLDYWWDVCHTK